MIDAQALVLGGGGASGAYTVGVLEALFGGRSPATGYRPLDPAIFTGTSIGAFLASFLVSSREQADWPSVLADLDAMWLDEVSASRGYSGAFRLRLNPLDLLHPASYRPEPFAPLRRLAGDVRSLGRHGATRLRRMFRGRKPLAERMMELMDGHALFALDELDRILRRRIDFPSLQSSERALRITATRWREGTLEIFDNAAMSEQLGPQVIKASCTVPGCFTPTRVGDSFYIDGSMRLYAPVSPAVRAGGREIHLVYMNVNVGTSPVDGKENSVEALFRALVIYWLADVEREIERARAYNQALALLSGTATPATSDPDLASFFDAAEAIRSGFSPSEPLHPITIHRYFPRSTPYEGTLSFTSLERERMEAMIEQGIEETRAHDCEVCGCVLP